MLTEKVQLMSMKILCHLGLRSMEGDGDIGERPGLIEGALRRGDERGDEKNNVSLMLKCFAKNL